ncbi:MAG TPA: tetratricopeptide repeat protein [Williamwhitmania sp.]|nr:tetratricopeptide repeat protein [Williamwhitmania sp.]
MQFKTVLTIVAFALQFSIAYGQKDSVIEHYSTLKDDYNQIKYLYQSANKVVADNPALASNYLLLAESIFKPGDSCSLKPLIRSGFIKVYRFQGKLDEALVESNKALDELETCSNDYVKAGVLLAKGGICFRLGKNDEAVEVLESAEKIFIQLALDKELSSVYNLLGGVQWARGNYPKAIETFLKAIKLKEKVNDSIGIANVYNNIGIIYDDQKDYKNAVIWYQKALAIYRAKDFNSGLRNALNNLGVAYKNMKEYNKAYMVLEESLLMEKKVGNISGIGYSANNIGEVLLQKGNYVHAEVYIQKAINSLMECGEESGLPACYINLGRINEKLGRRNQAVIFLHKGLSLALKYKDLEKQKEANYWLYSIRKEQGDLGKALRNFEQFHSISDTLNGVQAKKQLNELMVQYGSEKKESRIQTLEKEQLFQNVLLKKKRLELLIASIASLMLLVLAIMLFYNYYQKRNAFRVLALKNIEIEEQKEEMSTQRDEISKTNLRITDSIHYAKTIQNALLTPFDSIKKHFSSYIYFNLPKDIVSGDFIWTGMHGRKMIISAVDCTGHGVPGAFMSMLAITYLNQIFSEVEEVNPAWFISRMKEKIEQALHQRGRLDDSHDGLAISLAVIDVDTRQLDFASAGMKSVVLRRTIKGNEVIRLKGNTTAIGYYKGGSDFHINSVNLLPNDRFFMFSDGYADQFGGPTGRRLLYKGFAEIISRSADLPIEKQLEVIESSFYQWKGDREQIDDVMVFGLEI